MVAAVSDVYDDPALSDNVGDFVALGVDIETTRGSDRSQGRSTADTSRAVVRRRL